MIIAPVGSCRIHDPLIAAMIGTEYKIANLPAPSFTHNSSEALQRIRHYMGNYDYPPHLKELQTRTNSTRLLKSMKFEDIDVFLVEISSKKLLKYEANTLQWNNFTSHVRKSMGVDIGGSWLKKMDGRFKENGGHVIGPDGFDYPIEINEAKAKIFSSVIAETQNLEQLEEEIVRILSLTNGKAIFVNHINVKKRNGRLIRDRNELIESIQMICQKNNFSFIDPSDLLKKINQEDLMKDSGLDSNHYNEQWVGKVGDFLLERVKQIVYGDEIPQKA